MIRRLKCLPLVVVLILLLGLCPLLVACQDSDLTTDEGMPPIGTPKDSHGNYILDDAQQYGTKTGLIPGDTDFIQAHLANFNAWLPQGYTYQTYQMFHFGQSSTRYIVKFNTYTSDNQVAWQDTADFDTLDSPNIDAVYSTILEQVIDQEIIHDDLNGPNAAEFNKITISPTNLNFETYYWNPNDYKSGENDINDYNCGVCFCDENWKPAGLLTSDVIIGPAEMSRNANQWLRFAEKQSLQGLIKDSPLWNSAAKKHIAIYFGAIGPDGQPPYQQFRTLARKKGKDYKVDAYYDKNGTATKAN